jgi:metallophosphoesterase (TIGR00282 family)
VQINILCIGDVVGRPGKFVLSHALPGLVRERSIDCVIANVENIAGGSGMTPQLYEKVRRQGVDLMTMGDHIYRRGEIIPVLQRSTCVVRPANYPARAAGREFAVFQTKQGPSVAVVSIMGRLFMKPIVDCPFEAIDRVLVQLPKDVKIVVVDVHAETTSEKVALGWHLDGRASVVFGTHTHIPTADERILPQGTAYITDVGMTGPYESVLGRRTDRVTHYLTTGMPEPFEVATGDVRLCGIVATVDAESGRATHIERIRVDAPPRGAGDEGDEADSTEH